MEQLIDIRTAAILLGLGSPTIRKVYDAANPAVQKAPAPGFLFPQRAGSLVERAACPDPRRAIRQETPARTGEGERMTPLEVFRGTLPARPRATDDFRRGLWAMDRMRALEKRYVEHNGPRLMRWAAFDVDRPGGAHDWQFAMPRRQT